MCVLYHFPNNRSPDLLFRFALFDFYRSQTVGASLDEGLMPTGLGRNVAGGYWDVSKHIFELPGWCYTKPLDDSDESQTRQPTCQKMQNGIDCYVWSGDHIHKEGPRLNYNQIANARLRRKVLAARHPSTGNGSPPLRLSPFSRLRP